MVFNILLLYLKKTVAAIAMTCDVRGRSLGIVLYNLYEIYILTNQPIFLNDFSVHFRSIYSEFDILAYLLILNNSS